MVTSSHLTMCSAGQTRKAVDQPDTQHLSLCLQPVAACLFKPAMLHGLTSGIKQQAKVLDQQLFKPNIAAPAIVTTLKPT